MPTTVTNISGQLCVSLLSSVPEEGLNNTLVFKSMLIFSIQYLYTANSRIFIFTNIFQRNVKVFKN